MARIEWTRHAERDLGRLESDVRDRIVAALDRLAQTGTGDLKKLQGSDAEWRMRVGDWRVIVTFDVSAHTIIVLRLDRRDRAYR